MFVGTGLWDSQVQYYEPAKWVARLRANKTDSNPLRVPGQHGGGPRRQVGTLRAVSRRSREYYAFMLNQLGSHELEDAGPATRPIPRSSS